MKKETIERVLRSSKKINVLNFPVGIEVYLLNPYRICNISPNGEWKKTGQKLNTEFNKFVAFSKINKLQKTPIGPGAEILFSEIVKKEFNKVKSNLNKAHAKIVWKIFWLNHLEQEYDNLPREIEEIDINNLSDHAKAILYHFLAINDSLNLLHDVSYKFNSHYWEKAFDYWAKVINDPGFWNEIETIIETEKANGNFEFRNYEREKVKEELVYAIFNTLLFIPLKLIEQNLNGDKNRNAERSKCISMFLGVILKSHLGIESIRFEQAKQLTENKISKDVTTSIKEIKFKKWADNGEYRELYDNGMSFIDRIHTVTEQLKNDAHDKDIHTSTFLAEIPKIPSVHERVIGPLLEGIESSEILFSDSAKRKIKNLTMFTQLLLGIRILCELNLDVATKGKLLKNIEQINNRFSYQNIPYKTVKELNKELDTFDGVVNVDYLNKFYISHYCYFIKGENADPDASFYKKYKTTKGVVTYTNYTFIPRSKLAKDYHDSKIKLADVKQYMRQNKSGKDLKERLKTLNQLIPNLTEQKKNLENRLKIYFDEKQKVSKEFENKRNGVTSKIEKEFTLLQKGVDYLTQYRSIEIKKKKTEEKKKEVINNSGFEENKVKIRKGLTLGIAFMVAAVLYIVGSLTLFHFYGLIGLLLFGIVGLFFIVNANSIEEKNKEIERKNRKETDPLNKSIGKEDEKIKALDKELLYIAESKFSNEMMHLKNLEFDEINRLGEKHDVENMESMLKEILSEIDKSNKEIISINKSLNSKNEIKGSDQTKNHPVVKIVRGY